MQVNQNLRPFFLIFNCQTPEQITKDILISISRYRKLDLDNETIRNIIIEDYRLDEQEIDTFLGK